DEVVPLRDEVVDGTPGRAAREERPRVAEGNATVHAARPLLLERRLGQVVVELVPVPNAGVRIAPRGLAPLVLHEASQLSHFEKRLLLLLAAQAGGVLGVQLEG